MRQWADRHAGLKHAANSWQLACRGVILYPRWPVRASGPRSLRSATPPHAPRRLGFILRPVPPPVARGPGRLCAIPARRAVQRHRPLSRIQRLQWLSIHLVRQKRRTIRPFHKHRDERATCVTQCAATRDGVTGACLPPLMVWLGRAVKVVHAAAYASRRGSTVDRAPFAKERASRKARAESALCFRGKLRLMLSHIASLHATPRAPGPKSFPSKHRDPQLCPAQSHSVQRAFQPFRQPCIRESAEQIFLTRWPGTFRGARCRQTKLSPLECNRGSFASVLPLHIGIRHSAQSLDFFRCPPTVRFGRGDAQYLPLLRDISLGSRFSLPAIL